MALVNPAMLNLRALPCLSIPERNALPSSAAIYFVIGEGDVVLYIGRAKSLKQRWRAHHKLADMFGNPTARIAWMLVDEHALLPDIEAACLAHFQPPFNNHRTNHSPKIKPYPLRLPEPLQQEIEAIAAQEARSVNAQIRVFLQTCIAQYRAQEREQSVSAS